MTDNPRFKVTVEDLETGDKQAMEVGAGDYMLIPFAPCRLVHTQRSIDGAVQVSLAGHQPTAPGRQVEP
jgi:hypothetical protein